MDTHKLKEIVVKLLTRAQSPSDIVQALSKSEIDEVEDCLIEIGYKLVKAQLPKGTTYKIPGVESTGHVPEGHPERQLVVDHINKLNNLPADHKLKGVAQNIANALYEKHIAGSKVIDDSRAQKKPISQQPAATAAAEPSAPALTPVGQKAGDVDFETANRRQKATRAMGVFNYRPKQ